MYSMFLGFVEQIVRPGKRRPLRKALPTKKRAQGQNPTACSSFKSNAWRPIGDLSKGQ
jgi:hypothetical protein